MTFTWQSVTKNIHAENLGQIFDHQLDRIKKQLVHFPQNSVHLNIALEKNAKKELFTAALTLHLPSNILHSEKAAPKMLTAFDKAVDALIREISALKADLRGENQWEQTTRCQALNAEKEEFFSQEPIPMTAPGRE